LQGRYGVIIGKNVWHRIEALEPNSCISDFMLIFFFANIIIRLIIWY